MMWTLVPLVTAALVSGVLCTAPEVPWWSNAMYYRILVDSFKDSDGDGLGDLMGATKQLSYTRALGADAVILSPLLPRSTDCSKPGVIDFTDLEPRYGNIQSLSNLLEKAKQLELKVVLSFPIQKVSVTSEWFGSSANRTMGFEDWVLWRDGNADEPPLPERGIDSWIWNENRKSYYATTDDEAVLNLCSVGVHSALASAQCAWLRRGFDGILLSPDFPLDQNCAETLLRKMAAEAMSCVRGSNLETPVILAETRESPELAARYYADGGVGANSVLSTAMTSSVRTTAPEMALALYTAMLNAPSDASLTWMTSSSNASRLASRYGNEFVDAINMLTLTLPGAVVVQQGDELGAADTLLEWASANNTCWPMAKVPSAAPFSWDATTNAGFTKGEPWLPLAPNYRYANAKTQFSNEGSHAGVAKIAAAMRKSPAIGPHTEIKRLGQALAVLRWGGAGSLMVVSNLARDPTEAQLSKVPGLPAEMAVAASSSGSSVAAGSHISLEKTLKLAPGETVLLAGPPRHCGGPGPVDKITNKLAEGWQKINKYFGGS